MKFYRNQGDPLTFDTIIREPIPEITVVDGEEVISWGAPEMGKGNFVLEKNMVLAREADLLPGIYYSILGMREHGYRFVKIPPHLFAHSMYEVMGIEKESVIKLEIFLTAIR